MFQWGTFSFGFVLFSSKLCWRFGQLPACPENWKNLLKNSVTYSCRNPFNKIEILIRHFFIFLFMNRAQMSCTQQCNYCTAEERVWCVWYSNCFVTGKGANIGEVQKITKTWYFVVRDRSRLLFRKQDGLQYRFSNLFNLFRYYMNDVPFSIILVKGNRKWSEASMRLLRVRSQIWS